MDSIGKNLSRKLYPGEKEEISIFWATFKYNVRNVHIADMIEMEGRWNHRVHKVVTAAFWRTFNHEGKISPGW